MSHPALIVANAIQEVTAIVQQRLDNGERSASIDAEDVIEILLSIAERIENAATQPDAMQADGDQ